ncbi:hypothetical protein N9R54_01045 [Pelobium sp.]|nr:hypothetical protein [Pelobium sp.]MDA9554795.1 hypothetical protein [Pelobium sp.]
MKTTLNKYRIAFSIAAFFASSSLFAQSDAQIIKASAQLKIDGKLTEFADSLQNYDKTTHLYYAFANDANNLYVFIKANNRQDQSKIMAGGISVSVNANGKKKAVSTITFPVVDRTAMMAEMRNRGNREERPSGQAGNPTAGREEMRKRILGQLKEIKINGLKDLSVESISIYNTYGIKTGINYNDKDALIYELAIPLALVNVNDLNKEIAINVKLNGLQMPESTNNNRGDLGGESYGSGSGRMGAMGGGFYGRPSGSSYGGEVSPMFTSTEFWVKAKLAQ